MDKMYNNLMDIVNRTKNIGGEKRVVKKVERVERPEGDAPIDEAVHTVRKTTSEKKALFAENSAIGKLLTSKKAPAKKKTTAKKEEDKPAKKTTKSATKKTTTKKTTTKKTATKSTKSKTAEKKTEKKTETKKPEIKKEPAKKVAKVEKEAPKLDLTDPKNLELYNALKSSLFSEGTDISDYVEEKKDNESKDILKALQAKKEATRLNQEISKEQQEYEALFNGTLGEVVTEESEEDKEEISRLQEYLRPKIQKEEESVKETNVGKIDDEVESKIAEYYKRKNAKIEEFMKSELEEEPEEEKREVYEDRQREYEDIFSSGMTSRSSLFGEEERQEDIENVESEDQNQEENIDTYDDNMVTSFEYMENENSDDRSVDVAENILPVESDLEEFMKPKEVAIIEETKIEEESHDKIEEDEEDEEDLEENSFVFIKNKDEEDRPKTEREIIEDFHNDKEEDDYAKYDDEELDRYSNFATSTEDENEEIDEVEDEELEDDEDYEEETLDEESEESNDEVLEVTEEESDLIFVNKYQPEDDSDAYENELSKYIISDNMPTEKKGEHYDRENNTIVVDGDNLQSIDGMVVEDVAPKEVDEDDSISKEEFYNEMARLQENLINELKGNKTEEGVDLFSKEEVEKTKAEVEEEPEEVEEEPRELTEEEKAENLVNEIIYSIVRDERLQNIVEGVVEENHKFDDFDLLGKDAPLNEDDLEYIRQNKEKDKELKDKYFYLSAEDNEKKQEIEDAYMDMYNDEVSGNIREIGDINLNKDIYNAVPYVEEYTEEPIEEDDNVSDEEMEAIYTLFGIEKKKVVKMEKEMKVLYVASECQPFIATGGLADVAGSVTKVLAKNGVDCRVILPLYGQIKEKYKDKLEYLGNFTVHLSWRQEYCGLFRIYQDGVTFYFIDNERYFNREKTYGYYDDGERFAYFSKAIVESLPVINFFPDIIHCNDWQSALVSVYIKTGNWSDHRYYKIKHIYTIHNIEYQGIYGMENLKDLFGIDYRFKNDLEYNGDINLSKAAILYSDKFTTVSDSYCDNLKEPYCSRGLHHIIIRNEHKLSGIVNGIDYDFYHPSIDKNLYKNYDINSIDDKVVNKKLWQDELGLPVDGETPMLAIVSRLVSLKGLGLVTRIAEEVLQNDVQLVVVGTGDQKYVDYFKSLEQKYPTKVRALCDKYSNELARKAYGASDIFLMPSKVEPCGISQMISSLYGSVPIVRETGGLKDTIKDFGCENGGNGYTFNSYNHNDLLFQINRAIRDYGDKAGWRRKVETCMAMDFSWDKSVKKYLDLYKSIVD